MADASAEQLDQEVGALLERGAVDEAASLAIRRLGPSILGWLRAVIRDADDADDAFARFAESLWSSLRGFRRECSLKTWTHRLAWQAALRILEDPYRRRREALPTTEATRIAAEVRSRTSLARDADEAARVERLRRALAPEEQTMIILRFDRGLSWSEVAEVLAAGGERPDEAALRKRFERLKKRLRELAIAEGLLDG
ncbi:MAG TPA: sigma-70 family RNA polymerase sigma factor [Polyangia bacterium]|nr:sigma-70 family RNA polymerase sigma factor [Polyangia bacterium]